MTTDSNMNWCPECRYKWQTWTESRKIVTDIFVKMDKFRGPGISQRKICPECAKKNTVIADQVCREMGIV